MGELIQTGRRGHGRRRRLFSRRLIQMLLLLAVHGEDKTREGRGCWALYVVVASIVVLSTD